MNFEAWYAAKEKKILEDYFTFLRFPSVSAKPSHKKDVLACCDFLQKYIEKMGFKAERWEGSGHPTIFAERIVDANKPTILCYGHYDVQPEEPLELWKSNPFEPEIRDERVYARGAEDNKGQLFYTLAAIQAFLEIGSKNDLNIKLLYEGEEEMGSQTLHEILPKYKKQLKADHLLIVDMGMGSLKRPSLTIGARGLMTMEVTARNADTDLHSGEFGGISYNPIRALSEVLGRIIDKDGRVTIKGFYDGIKPLSEEEKKRINFEFNKETFKQEGIKAFHKETGYNPVEACYFRPTFEINGLSGGYTGPGFKTVLPKEVHAKLSCRLVPNQDADHIFDLVAEHIKNEMPKDMLVTVTRMGGGPAAWANPLSKTTEVMKKAYETVFGKCDLIYGGGSIPITTLLAECSGAEFVLPGTGLSSDCIHAPNENFSLYQFRSGFLVMANCLNLFAQK